jgi:sugar-specific transcriptional regulator TrmB
MEQGNKFTAIFFLIKPLTEANKFSLERVIKTLISLGFSKIEAEVYVHLAAIGPATVRNMIRGQTFDKRQTYRSLKALQQKGIVSGNQEYPAEFSAISFEKALDLLLEVKKEQAKTLEASRTELISDFQTEKKKAKDDN